MLNETAALAEYVHASLVAVVDLIATDGGVAIGRDPHAREVVRVDLVVYELAEARLVHVYAARLAVVDLTVNYGGVGAGFHFETGDSVIVNVVRFEIALRGWNLVSILFWL